MLPFKKGQLIHYSNEFDGQVSIIGMVVVVCLFTKFRTCRGLANAKVTRDSCLAGEA